MQISIYSCLWLRDDGEYHSVGLSTQLCIFDHSLPILFSEMSELIQSFQSYSLICPNPTLRWWPHPLFPKKVEASSGNLSASPSTTPPWCLCVLSLCSPCFADSSPSQPDFTNRCLHVLSPFPNWYLVPDSLQSSFGPHCDTEQDFLREGKTTLWALFSLPLTPVANSSSAWTWDGGDLQTHPLAHPPFFLFYSWLQLCDGFSYRL